MQHVPEILTFVGSVSSVCSVLVAARALLLNLERSRRELSVKLIYDWSNDLQWPTSRAVKLATLLPREIVLAIGRQEKVSVPAKFCDGVASVLRSEFPDATCPDRSSENKQNFEMTAEQSEYIRFLWIQWLNRLEGTLSAWATGAGDLKIMHAEFEPLVKGKEPTLAALAELRDGLPILDEFYKRVRKQGAIEIAEPLGFLPRKSHW